VRREKAAAARSSTCALGRCRGRPDWHYPVRHVESRAPVRHDDPSSRQAANGVIDRALVLFVEMAGRPVEQETTVRIGQLASVDTNFSRYYPLHFVRKCNVFQFYLRFNLLITTVNQTIFQLSTDRTITNKAVVVERTP
jgi:hypothetical protein